MWNFSKNNKNSNEIINNQDQKVKTRYKKKKTHTHKFVRVTYISFPLSRAPNAATTSTGLAGDKIDSTNRVSISRIQRMLAKSISRNRPLLPNLTKTSSPTRKLQSSIYDHLIIAILGFNSRHTKAQIPLSQRSRKGSHRGGVGMNKTTGVCEGH